MGDFLKKVGFVFVAIAVLSAAWETSPILVFVAFWIWFAYFNITWIKKHREKYSKKKPAQKDK